MLVLQLRHPPYSSRCDVINRGFSGYNSRWCRHVAPQLFSAAEAEPEVALVIVLLGANDSNSAANTAQHVPSGEFRDNMAAIVGHFLVSKARITSLRPTSVHVAYCV